VGNNSQKKLTWGSSWGRKMCWNGKKKDKRGKRKKKKNVFRGNDRP